MLEQMKQPVSSIFKAYQPWPKDASVVMAAATEMAKLRLKYGEPPVRMLRADWGVRYLRLHKRSYQELKRESPFYRSRFALSGVGARHGGLSSFPQNIGAYAVRVFTPSRLEEPGCFNNHLPTVLDPFAGPNSRLELTWRCNRNYIGWDCCQEFMIQNRQVRDLLYLINGQCPIRRDAQIWLVENDSRHINYDSVADMLLTSIPYWDTEYYGPEAAQLGKTKTYDDFLKSLVQIFKQCYIALKPGAFMAVEAQDYRRKGKFYLLGATDIMAVLEEAGFILDGQYVVDYRQAMNAAFINQLWKLKITAKQHAYLAIARKPDSKLLQTQEAGRGFEQNGRLAESLPLGEKQMSDLIVNNTHIEKYEIKGREIYVKREDLSTNRDKLMPPLAKMRGAFELISKLHDGGVSLIGNIDSPFSKSGQGVAAICKELGMNCVIGYPRSKNHLPEQLKIAEQLGAELYPLRANYIRVHYYQTKKYVESKGGIMLPFGIACVEATKAVAEEAKTIPEELLSGTLVICVGSGTMLSGVVAGVKQLPKIIGVSSGMSSKNQFKNIRQLLAEAEVNIERLSEFEEKFTLVSPIMAYSEACNIDTPFPSHGNYDKKAWKYLVDNIDSLSVPVLFWNIGA